MDSKYWAALIIIAGANCVWVVLMSIALRRRRYPAVHKMVFTLLDDAYANGHSEPGERCHGMSPDEIAYDMTLYAPDCENLRPEFLTPYVRAWMQQKGLE
jgi:hypothetical protein